jgi:hypothetical protein
MVFDDAKARVLLREMSIWMHGYCSALGDDAPFTGEHLLAFTAGDGALHHRIQEKEREAALVEEPPPASSQVSADPFMHC